MIFGDNLSFAKWISMSKTSLWETKMFPWLLSVIGNKIPVCYMKWVQWRKNYQFWLQVTECGVEEEPARRAHLKQEVPLQLDGRRSLRTLLWQLQVLNASEDQPTNGRWEAYLSVSSGPLYSWSSAEGKPNNWITTELCCFTKLCEKGFVTSVLDVAVTMAT